MCTPRAERAQRRHPRASRAPSQPLTGDAAFEQDARQPAHARAGDPHDVHPAELGQRRHDVGGGATHQGRAGRLPSLWPIGGVVGRGPAFMGCRP